MTELQDAALIIALNHKKRISSKMEARKIALSELPGASFFIIKGIADHLYNLLKNYEEPVNDHQF